MIGRIKGILLDKTATQVLVDVGGLAYELEVPVGTMFQLPETGREVILHTHLVVREDARLLYGFHEHKERELFRILIKVNGVGPKMALVILSGLSVSELAASVQSNDVDSLVRLPGIGRKTAERLIIELRDRLKSWQPSAETGAKPGPGSNPVQASLSAHMQEAEAALIALGYKPQEAGRAVVQAHARLEEEALPVSVEALLRQALRKMNS